MAGSVWKAGREGCGVSRHVEGDDVAGDPGPADQVELGRVGEHRLGDKGLAGVDDVGVDERQARASWSDDAFDEGLLAGAARAGD